MFCQLAQALGMLSLLCEPATIPVQQRVMGGDAVRGRAAITEVACNVCHVIPGIPGPQGRIGPSLAGFADRAFIAGAFPNRPSVLIRFVRDAPSVEPTTAMPRMPIDEQMARDMAAYLMTLR